MSGARTWIYLAGPDSARAAILEAARCLFDAGAAVVFMAESASLIERHCLRLAACHAVLRLPGASLTADLVVERAKVLAVPVYHDLEACLAALGRSSAREAC